MDKTDIKNVINNPTSKFDVALKMHARKKLREEIRKQLQNMNLTNNDNKLSNENLFQPDESIESGQIPEAILNEISKSLGIELITEAGLNDENYLSEIDAAAILNTEDIESSLIDETLQQNESEIIIPEINSPSISSESNNLIEKIKNIETTKSTIEKEPKKTSNDKRLNTKDLCTKKKVGGKKNLTLSSSNSDSSNSSSDSESNSSSSDSDSSNSSSSSSSSSNSSKGSNATKRSSSLSNKAKRQNILEGNVITHFNTLTLPMMPVRERQKYEKRNFKDNTDTLLYILDYCLKKTETTNDIPLTIHRKKNLKKNLKSKDNEEVLQFLTQKIKEIFEASKLKKRSTNSNSKVNKKTPNTTPKPKKKKQNEKMITPTSQTTSTIPDAKIIPDGKTQNTPNSNKTPVKRKYCRKSLKNATTDKSSIKLSTKNATPITEDQISTVVNSNTNSNPFNKISQIQNNPILEKSKNHNKIIQEENNMMSISNKETLIDHKGINNNKEIISTEIEGIKVARSAINNNSITDNVEYNSSEIIQSKYSENNVNIDDGDCGRMTITSTTIGCKNKIEDETIRRSDDVINSICLETFLQQNVNKEDETNKVINIGK